MQRLAPDLAGDFSEKTDAANLELIAIEVRRARGPYSQGGREDLHRGAA